MKTIFTSEEIKNNITKEQYKKITLLGESLNKRFSKCNSVFFRRYNMYNIAEIIINKEVKNESDLYKETLLSSSIYPNNAAFAKILLENGLDLETLDCLNSKNDEEKELLLSQIDRLSEKLCGTNNQKNIIINKINQLLVFNPEYLIPEKELIELNEKTKEITNSLKNNSNIEFIYYNLIRNTGKVSFKYNVIINDSTKDITPVLSEISTLLDKYLKEGKELKNIEFCISITGKNKFQEKINENPEKICNQMLNSKILFNNNSDLVESISNAIYSSKGKEKNKEYINALAYKLPEKNKKLKINHR